MTVERMRSMRRRAVAGRSLASVLALLVAGEAAFASAPMPRPNPVRVADAGDITGAVIPVAKPALVRPVQASAAGAAASGLLESLSPSNVGLKAALALIDDGNVGKALAVARLMPDPVARNIVEWLVAQSGSPDVPVEQITAVSLELAHWPGQAMLRRRAEQALARSNEQPARIIDAFRGSPPSSDEGVALLVRAYLAAGRAKDAAAVIRPKWRSEELSPALQLTVTKEFANLLTPADHKARMAMFFYRGNAEAALQVAQFLDKDTRALAQAWAAVIRRQKNADALLAALPAKMKRDPGYLFAQVQQLRRAEKYRDATKMMLEAPRDAASLVDPDAWWVERRVLSRELLDLGDPRTAYRLAAAHSAESSAERAEAEFHAGWYALRFIGDAKTARRHFEEIQRISSMPISQARAEYWLARTAEAAGDKGEAERQYRRAAAYPTTYYGQLATARLGIRELSIPRAPRIDKAALARFEARDLVRAHRLLEAAGADRLARQFLNHLADTLSEPVEIAILADMAEKEGDHQTALAIGKKAQGRGLPVDALAYPVAAIPKSAKTAGVERSVVYAIARQESGFNPGAVSRAGARGLLQLMPATARITAKAAGLPYSEKRLTSDPAYNATLGAAHLGDLFDGFNGSYIMTFAAYNAGRSRVLKWVADYGDPRDPGVDVVDWIERIPYTETRNYVMRCMENLQVYRARLGEPALKIERDLRRGGPA